MKGNRRRKDRLSRFPCPDGRLIQIIPVHVVNSTFLRQFRYLFRLCIQNTMEREVCQGFSIWFSGNGDWGLGTGDWGLEIGDWGLGSAALGQNLYPCRQKIVFAHRRSGQLVRGGPSILACESGPAFGNTVSPSGQADTQSAFTSLALKAISLVVSMLSKRMR